LGRIAAFIFIFGVRARGARRHGAAWGTWPALTPDALPSWHPGGHDPVPDRCFVHGYPAPDPVLLCFLSLLLFEGVAKVASASLGRGSGDARCSAPSAPAVTAKAAKAPADVPPGTAPTGVGSGERLRVRTDTMLAEIDTQGGDLAYLELLKHRDTLDDKKNFVLFGPGHRYAAQSGLIGEGLPNHRTLFRAAGREFNLAEGQDSLDVRLEAVSAGGVKVAKILTFHRGSYRIDAAAEVENGTAAPLTTCVLSADARRQASRGDPYMAQSYTGAAVYTEQEKFQKVGSTTSRRQGSVSESLDNGWICHHPALFRRCVFLPA
jgi:YidC/Oxa1 family membrane protein insertase